MALDWSKQISFSGLKRKPARTRSEYPEKTYINLVVVDKKTLDMRRTIPMAVVLVLVVALFLKFGVFDFYARVDAKQAELTTHQSELHVLTSQLADYDAVLEEYEGYASLSIAESGLVVDAMDALSLVDRFVAPSARVASVALSGDTMTLGLADVTLDGVGKLVSTLYEQDIVSNVSVSTAATEKTSNTDLTATMTITLKPLAGEGA